MRLPRIALFLIALFLLCGCVSRYSTSQYGNKIVLKDNETNNAITTELSGAKFIGKGSQIISGMRMNMYVYEFKKDYIVVGTADTADYLQSSFHQMSQDPALMEALGIQKEALNMMNIPLLEKPKGKSCMLGLCNILSLNDKILLTIYYDQSTLSQKECSEVMDIEGFYAMFPERAEQFVAKATKAISVTQE